MLHATMALGMRLLTRDKLSILIYHSVFAEADPMRPFEPTAATFDWQMRLLANYFTPLSLNDAVAHLNAGTLPTGAVCVTFDDGYLNNLEVATPILRKYGVPATVYVSTGFSAGRNMWNDRVMDLAAAQHVADYKLDTLDMPSQQVSGWEQRRALAESLIGKLKYQPFEARLEKIDQLYVDNKVEDTPPRMMSPVQLRALKGAGVDIGAHTVDHPILTTLDAAEQQLQIKRSKETLEGWLDCDITGFAYPNGKINQDYDQTSVAQVRELGFKYALTTNWGVNSVDSSPFELNRFTPWDGQPSRFHLRLLRNAL